MRKLVLFLIAAILAVAFVSPAAAVERDYRLFLNDGSWVQIRSGLEIANGNVKARLRAGQLVVFSERNVDLAQTEAWNHEAAVANITTKLPLSRNLLHAPVSVAQSMYAESDLDLEGDPQARLWQFIRILDEKERELTRKRTGLQRQAAEAEDPHDALEIDEQINLLTRKIRGLRAQRNGTALQLKGWAE